MKCIESIKEFDGYLNRYTHHSSSCNCQMTFSVYLPPQASKQKVPTLYWLSGLTCTDDNARVKAGIQRDASRLGLAIVFPDTSPRGDQVADANRYDLGQGAGFYLNATQLPWSAHYQMYDYIVDELPQLLEQNLPLIPNAKSISGHSMGGHGALICALKNPQAYRSVSAFSPICYPSECEWGKTAFQHYLGEDQTQWDPYDATRLIQNKSRTTHILIDQGSNDEFLMANQLLPEQFKDACDRAGQPLTLRIQDGYDHSYHFVASFITAHLEHHVAFLSKTP